MQTEKSQLDGKRIMPEMRFKSQLEAKRIMPETRLTEFPVFSVDPRVGISQSALETDDRLFFLLIIGKIEV